MFKVSIKRERWYKNDRFSIATAIITNLHLLSFVCEVISFLEDLLLFWRVTPELSQELTQELSSALQMESLGF